MSRSGRRYLLPLLCSALLGSCGGGVSTSGPGDGGGPDGGGGSGGSIRSGTGGGTASGTGGATTSGTGGATASGTGGAQSIGTVTFNVRVAAGRAYCDEISPCNRVSHLSIRDSSGRALLLSLPFCPQRCSQECTPPICVGIACVTIMPMAYTGGTLVWDGAIYESGTCGANVPCYFYELRYAPAGHYIATVCALPGAPGQSEGADPICVRPSGQTADCVDVPFDLPSAAPVDVTLGG